MSDLTTINTWTNLLLPLIILGVGIGMVMAPVTTVIMASTPVQQSGMGAGILSTIRQIGSNVYRKPIFRFSQLFIS